MEFRLPFSRKDEKQTPENQPEPPESQPKSLEETLTGYLELLLKDTDRVSTVYEDDLVVLRTAGDEDMAESVVVIDHFEGETDAIVHQSFLVTSYEEGRAIWDVYDDKDEPEYHKDSPRLFVTYIERYFGEQLDAAKQAE